MCVCKLTDVTGDKVVVLGVSDKDKKETPGTGVIYTGVKIYKDSNQRL